MLDHEDLKWIASTSTELSAMLQQITRYADLARQNTTDYKYAEMLSERVETAWRTAQSLFGGVTARILDGNQSRISRDSALPSEVEREAPLNVIPTRISKGTPEKEAQPKDSSQKESKRAKANPIPASIKVLNDKGSRELILIVEDEREVAELGIAVAAARRETVDRLSALILAGRNTASPFPFATLALEGEIDRLVATLPAVDAEDQYRAALREGRARDRAAGRTLAGPQASDLLVRHGPKDIPADMASTLMSLMK